MEKEIFFNKILISLRRIIRGVNIHSKKLNSKFNITTPQMLCLLEISTKKNITLSELASAVSLSLSTVNGIMDRLKAKKLVSVEKSPEDKRKICINITETGKNLVHETPHLLHDQLVSGLSELKPLELTTIALGLEKIVEILEIDTIAAAPALAGEVDIPRRNGDTDYEQFK